jgi:uncharacterized protein YecT (DUF1311 family)
LLAKDTDIKRIALAVLLPAPGAGTAFAGSACDKPRNDFDGLYCLNKVYQQSDQDLNVAFGELREKLDNAARDALRAGQIAWLQTRDQSCSKREGSAFFVNLAWATQMTIARTESPQRRYRECISSGCMNGRLQ